MRKQFFPFFKKPKLHAQTNKHPAVLQLEARCRPQWKHIHRCCCCFRVDVTEEVNLVYVRFYPVSSCCLSQTAESRHRNKKRRIKQVSKNGRKQEQRRAKFSLSDSMRAGYIRRMGVNTDKKSRFIVFRAALFAGNRFLLLDCSAVHRIKGSFTGE